MNVTYDPKVHTIRIRINDEMHEHITDICQRTGTTTSDYIREMIERDMEKSPKNKKGYRHNNSTIPGFTGHTYTRYTYGKDT